MDDLSHGKKVLLMALAELALLILAVPLYIFLVLPNHPKGTLPGVLPLIGGEAGVVPSALAALGAFAVTSIMVCVLYKFFGNSHFSSPEVIAMADEFSVCDLIPIYLAAGIGEEALFRAALLEPCGLVGSSLLFTALHVAYWKKPLMLAYVFTTGLILGTLYSFTESLILCVFGACCIQYGGYAPAEASRYRSARVGASWQIPDIGAILKFTVCSLLNREQKFYHLPSEVRGG